MEVAQAAAAQIEHTFSANIVFRSVTGITYGKKIVTIDLGHADQKATELANSALLLLVQNALHPTSSAPLTGFKVTCRTSSTVEDRTELCFNVESNNRKALIRAFNL